MTTNKNNDHDTITIKAASMAGPFKVNTTGKGDRSVSFPTVAAAISFVEGFDVSLVTVQIGGMFPAMGDATRR